MQPKIKRFTTGSLLLVLTVSAGLMATAIWVVWHSRTSSTLNTPSVSGISIDEERLPDGWKKLEVKNKVTVGLPHDMKAISPLGDSYSYREAYSNGQIALTIVYGEAIVPLRDDQSHFLSPSCETPRLAEKTYQESLIDIDGRKAKLSIDRSKEEEFIGADVCFAKTDNNEVPLSVITYCKDDAALKIARQIFSSIRFKD